MYKKLALTGGIGARHEGEAFGEDYELPNLTSYNETCAAIGSIFWNHRLFLLEGNGQYYDVIERTLYNGFLSGISMEGNTFFYVNPLSSDGKYRFNREDSIVRQPWFGCSCCPTNVVRLLPSLSGYIYAVRDRRLYVNLYMSNQATMNIAKQTVRITQETNYPWDETVNINVEVDEPSYFTLSLRVPSWVSGQPLPGDLYHYLNDDTEEIFVRLNGEALTTEVEDGYINIEREWQSNDTLQLILPMSVRRVVAHDQVKDLAGKVALERGPVVYTCEETDNDVSVLEIALRDDDDVNAEFVPDLLGGITILRGTSNTAPQWTAIPYYAWSHRGIGEMTVWFNRM